MWLDTGLQAASQQGVEDTVILSSVVAAGEQVVLPSKSNGTDRVFHGIVVNVKTSFFAIPTDSGPHAESIADGFSQGAFGGAIVISPLHPNLHLL